MTDLPTMSEKGAVRIEHIIHTFNLNVDIETVELANAITRKRVGGEVHVGTTMIPFCNLKTRGGHCVKMCALDDPKNKAFGERNVFRFPGAIVIGDTGM